MFRYQVGVLAQIRRRFARRFRGAGSLRYAVFDLRSCDHFHCVNVCSREREHVPVFHFCYLRITGVNLIMIDDKFNLL